MAQVDRQFDFSGAVQSASSWLLRKSNEVNDSKNAVYNKKIGAIDRRGGYVQEGNTIQSGKVGLGLHESKFTTGAKTLVGINDSGDTFTTVRAYNKGAGTYTSFITDLEANSKINMIDYLDESYVAGMTTDTLSRQTLRNIKNDLTVSTTRNLLNAPKARFIAEFGGSLYAMNVQIGTKIYPDRAYKSSAPTGAVTYVKGAQDDVLTNMMLVDNVPPMTSNTAPFGTAAASTTFSGFQPYYAFDGNLVRAATWFSAGVPPASISYDFGSGVTKTITHYSMTPVPSNKSAGDEESAPKTWTFEGSNNGSTWTVVDTQTAVPVWGTAEKRVYATSNTTAYRYYRVNVSANQRIAAAQNLVMISEIELLTSTTGAQSITLAVDSVRYVKQGMSFDIYKAGTSIFLQTLTVDSVDKPNNTLVFTPYTLSFSTGSVNTSTDVLTLSSAANFPTGTTIKFDSSGTVPAGLTANTKYYSIYVSATTIKVATTFENALLGVAIDLTSTGSGTHRIRSNYSFQDNDELWLSGRYGELSLLWNTDYPTEAKSDFIRIPPGSSSDTSIVGWGKSNNRLFMFTPTSYVKWDRANLITVSENIGCANHESIATMTDWLVWLDNEGKIHARNDSSGQDEIISRSVKNKYMESLTASNFSQASGGFIDNIYKLSLGQVTIDGASVYLRMCYDFDMNSMAPETHTRPQLFNMTSNMSGKMRQYFLDNSGKMYLDNEGYLDDGATIPWYVNLGRNNSGSEMNKSYLGCYVFSDNASSVQVSISIEQGDPIFTGQLEQATTRIPFGISNESVFDGRDIDYTFSHNADGVGPRIEGIANYYNMIEDNLG